MMAADTFDRLGLAGRYVVKVNNRKVLDGVMEAIGLGGEDKAGQRLTVLRAIDKLDRLGPDGVRELLGAGRKDESGDFTKGAELSPEGIERVLGLTASKGATGADTIENLRRVVAGSARGEEGAAELAEIAALLQASGYDGRVEIDPSVVRGLEYYTGPVYEAELTFEVRNERGQPVRFGSVGGGGRYDGLVGRFRPEPVPATGFSIGVSRLLSALQLVNSPILAGQAMLPLVVVTAMDRDRVADYQAMVARLRGLRDGAGRPVLRAEMYLGSGKFGAQMKYADKRGAACVLIQGSDEKAQGVVQIKDLIEGAKAAQAIATNAEWKAARPAQFSVPEGELEERVMEVIARHG